ncbi:hypothetical protein GQ53DRAFT_697108 [Thozetella sp. PMI_491]|nr:hypothetical protein GQ53DRAFT_697108 [Thozetella sp. PMI_491]
MATMEGSPSSIGKFMPKSITAKRRRRKEGSIAETTASSNSIEDAMTPDKPSASRHATPGHEGAAAFRDPEARQANGYPSHDPAEASRDEENSLTSYESEPETTSRPTAISTHPSQIGYLTTSSPLVQAAHHPDSQTSESQRSSFKLEASVDSLDSHPNSASPQTQASSSGLAPAPVLHRPSSIGRLRGVFRSKRGSAGSASPSPERRQPAADTDRFPEPLEAARPDTTPPAVADPKPDLPPELARADPPAPPAIPAKASSSSDRIRRLSRGQKIDTSNPPRTPPNGDRGTPVIVNTPPTPTNHETPEGVSQSSDSPAGRPDVPSQGTMLTQRRGRAGSGTIVPSKLSNITPAPLTPTPENGPPTPGNTASNFFNSMISAVQSTANTLSNSITNTSLPGGHKQKPSISKDLGDIAEDTSVEVESSSEVLGEASESKEPAVKTLGMGDLSLSQLGIVDSGSAAPAPATAKLADHEPRARAESAPAESGGGVVETPSDDSHSGALNRPLSVYEPSNGANTPPPGSVYEGKTGVQRSNSIRSAIGRRRKRGSSAATGGTAGGMTIGAAIAAANASVAHPSAQSSTPKLTGFAVANKKRNRDFHTLFKSVPDDDYLIEDYSCALQREILAHGRLYISEGHLCFSSNIFGWITTLVISFDEIVSVEKRSTALVFKNGLEISTLHAKHIFASFASRDTTYDLIVKIWKLGHPHLKSSLNGVRLDETGGDRTEKVETESISIGGSHSASASDDDSEDGDDVYDEDEDTHDGFDTTQPTEAPSFDTPAEKAVSRKPSGAVAPNGTTEKPEEGSAPTTSADFPGPATHAPTDCGDAGTHYEKVTGDDIVQAPLGKVYSYLFGPMSVSFMSKWLTGDQKCTELQMEDKKGLTEDNKSRTYSYIRPLYASIGPKQTKCIVTEELVGHDLEKAVNILCTTQTPDVPSGNIFSVKTKYCLSWAENNATRIQANCTIEWTGKSWLKGPIEKGANDGQTQHFKDLMASTKAAMSSRPRSGTLTNGAAKGHKKRKKGKSAQASNPASDGEGLSKASPKHSWGMFEPVHPFLSPVVDIVKPLITGNVVYGLLVGLLVAAWFGFGTTRQVDRPYGNELGYLAYPHRMAAYEEMWRREESELWEWLEERLSMDRIHGSSPPPLPRKKLVDPKSIEEKLREDRMDEREIREAIRVTEGHLEVLKGVINRNNIRRDAGDSARPSAK